ncbi:hypothetical protein [Adhaeribacter arboris]|uniref:hypothetical protein n=1 Tax=Adhaeribacter arboris TaxID=2072846 RepID=UPI0018EC600E|nr:hypothetical protein [Adhaeribacter arboris]
MSIRQLVVIFVVYASNTIEASMNVISYPTIKAYFEQHAAAKAYLLDWYYTTKKATWNNVNEMRQISLVQKWW